jgi:hypothetical protein
MLNLPNLHLLFLAKANRLPQLLPKNTLSLGEQQLMPVYESGIPNPAASTFLSVNGPAKIVAPYSSSSVSAKTSSHTTIILVALALTISLLMVNPSI